jgi:glycosyltransferase involved in cell wall biosynthesis
MSDQIVTTSLRSPTDFAMNESPLIGLHVMAKNAANVLPRLIESVEPYIVEAVFVLNDTTDGSEALIRKILGKKAFILHVDQSDYPQFYILDSRDTYENAGPSLMGESFTDALEFSQRPLLSEWAKARNVGWERGATAWRLHLDADDVLQDPTNLWGSAWELDRRGCDLAFSPYSCDRGLTEVYRERLVKRFPTTFGPKWNGPIHETITGHQRGIVLESVLKTVDLRDNLGDGTRVHARNFKVLYYHCRKRFWEVPARLLLLLGMEARRLMPEFATAILRRYLKEHSTRPNEEKAWALTMLGEISEYADDFRQAEERYREALSLFPNNKVAYRLARVCFHQGDWHNTINAYDLGQSIEGRVLLLDGSAGLGEMTGLLVVAAYDKLGMNAKAKEMVTRMVEKYPDKEAVRKFAAYILGKV